MTLYTLSIRRPVLALVMSIAIVLFGVIGLSFLGVREFPSVDSPVITVATNYRGASADVVESQITEPLDLGRAGVVLPELFRSLLTVNWHGLSFCLLALPWLLAVRRVRPIAAVCCLQLAFYVYVYLSAPVDPREYVATSAARLYFHLVPTVLVLGIATADRWAGGRQRIE